MRDRYAQCDGTCTVDCGACKGKGRPTTSVFVTELAAALGHVRSEIHTSAGAAGVFACAPCFVTWPCATVRAIEQKALPVVLADRERHARQRAAEEVEFLARGLREAQAPGFAQQLDRRAGSLRNGMADPGRDARSPLEGQGAR